VGRAIVVQISAQELRKHLRGIHALGIGLREVGRAVIVHHAGHLAGEFPIRAGAFELFHSTREAEEENQVSARAAARGSNSLRVDAEPGRVGAQKPHRRLHIMNGRGKLIAGSQR
jgi:hypothetical protein